MSKGLLDKNWISDQLERFTAHSEALIDLAPDSDTDPDYGPLTALKLFLIAAQVDVYTKIIPKRFDHTYYIDALAGSGLTHVRDYDVAIAGSPLIAATVSHKPLERYYFVEKDHNRANALAARLDYLHDNTTLSIPRDRCEIRIGDANDEIPAIMDEIKEQGDEYGFGGVNRCAVVDNEALDFEWDALKQLLQPWGDTLINFPATRISRDQGKQKLKEITRFFGSPEWEQCNSEKAYRELYTNRIKETTSYNVKQRSIRVDSRPEAKRYYYELLYTTRITGNESPYIKAIDTEKQRLERLSGADVAAILDVQHGAEQTNFHFFEEDTDTDTDGAQQTLTRYSEEL
ncbi:three-Cys-motif partner protein TcmP [Halocatena salina]|uniref:Three-Cys-motif partner protein TcmP n=1 Tax=Halocatena salina TaxID=2934340 RepID=A0A8U0A6T5_9EURY|nr:three-Cys-motif partner protein TcmP [Halocatena salina]UPM44845.1 three-Cys-motif partner protein TcmP [Halocatena salina]